MARKLFRVGKPLAFIKAASVSYANKTTDPILRLTSILRAVSYAVYFTTDTFVWLNGSKVYTLTNAQPISRLGNKFWLFGMLCNIVNSLRRHQIANAKQLALAQESGEKDSTEIKKVLKEKKAAEVQFLWDVLDTSIPIANLGIANLDDGFVGLAGFITAALGVKQQWASTY